MENQQTHLSSFVKSIHLVNNYIVEIKDLIHSHPVYGKITSVIMDFPRPKHN